MTGYTRNVNIYMCVCVCVYMVPFGMTLGYASPAPAHGAPPSIFISISLLNYDVLTRDV